MTLPLKPTTSSRWWSLLNNKRGDVGFLSRLRGQVTVTLVSHVVKCIKFRIDLPYPKNRRSLPSYILANRELQIKKLRTQPGQCFDEGRSYFYSTTNLIYDTYEITWRSKHVYKITIVKPKLVRATGLGRLFYIKKCYSLSLQLNQRYLIWETNQQLKAYWMWRSSEVSP